MSVLLTYPTEGLLTNSTFSNLNVPISLTEEICDNGIDDDGDNLIDCFDPDCCGTTICEQQYYNPCLDTCAYSETDNNFSLKLEWLSEGNNWHPYNTPIVGDLDGDGRMEIIGNKGDWNGLVNYKDLLVIDADNGTIEATITTPWFRHVGNELAIADVDRNGWAEIFVVAGDLAANSNYYRNKLICYEYNGVEYQEKWVSDEVVAGKIVKLADFNQDGTAEVYLANSIYSSLSGKLLLAGVNAPSGGDEFSIAADVLPDDYCTNCQGLEIVAGNSVYSVDLNANDPNDNRINLENQLETELSGSGATSLADMDLDGDLDAVVTRPSNTVANEAVVFVWDIQTNSLLASHRFPSSTNGYASLANLIDINGDGLPEIGIGSTDLYQLFTLQNGQFKLLWDYELADWSARLGSTVFDFNHDRKYEVLLRDQNTLRVFDALTGDVVFATACESVTLYEYPVVADIDQDGEVEILCSCENGLRAFGSGFEPWISGRSIWNQYAYHYTNVNDDLTIPAVQQANHLVGNRLTMNKFLNQYANLFNQPEIDIELPADVSIEAGDRFTIISNLTGEGNVTYEWSPATDLSCTTCPNPIASPTEDTKYTLLVASDNGCSAEASIHIRVITLCSSAKIQVPSAITPNGDGVNDFFKVVMDGEPPISSSMVIFNRWGKKVFDDNSITAAWDGRVGGVAAPSDVYIYLIKLRCQGGEEQLLRGDFTLIR